MKPHPHSLRFPVLLATGLAILTHPAKCQNNIVLPAPIPGAFEDFESVNEGELPAGWTVVNHTDIGNPEPDLDDPRSASYEDWVVISRSRMESIGTGGGWDAGVRLAVSPGLIVNGVAVSELLTGKFIHAESDARTGSQVQFLFSPSFNCSGQFGVTLAFHSAYEQNQDSIGAVEYSTDGGTTWLPVAYLIDRLDILRDGEGNVDAVATLTTTDAEAAAYYDDSGNLIGGTYGSFIGAPVDASLGPFIQGRINDNGIESKRVELFRLPGADDKASVKLRFAYAGTSSWYWGLDNIGLYPIPPRTPPARPVISAPAAVPFLSTGIILAGGAFSGLDGSQTHAGSLWQIAVSGNFQADTGFSTPLLEIPSSPAPQTSVELPLDRLFPGENVQATVRYQDQFGNRSPFAEPVTFTVSSTIPVAVPGTFEDFESTTENGIPAGWSRSNQSEDGSAYPNWFVVTEGTLGGFGREVTNDPRVYTGNSLYVESDSQSGNQIQFVFTKEYDLTGIEGVWLAYKSNYMQNQDSFGGVEFSTDDGQSWQPVVLMLDISDLVLNTSGLVDATATLRTTYTDLARIITADGITRVPFGKYEDFILTRPIDGLAPFLSPRVNDDERESKRYQRYRLTAADNKPRVKFRFAHAGTSSWHWGIDDFGLYSTGSTRLAITSVRAFRQGDAGAPAVELKWASQSGRKYTVQSGTDLINWTNIAVNVTATGSETDYTHSGIPETDRVRYYRIREQP